ncbi:MAG: hypothetical protein LBR87_06435, partial [Synergistaceae bacterium]|nr:hypothetical protein [Synergistaceae bacterium]
EQLVQKTDPFQAIRPEHGFEPRSEQLPSTEPGPKDEQFGQKIDQFPANRPEHSFEPRPEGMTPTPPAEFEQKRDPAESAPDPLREKRQEQSSYGDPASRSLDSASL